INHSNETKMIFNAAKNVSEVTGTIDAAPQMGGEDFAFYLENKPGAFFFTGANIPEHTYPHHHPKFNIDERAMPIAAKMLISAYFEYQEHNAYIHENNHYKSERSGEIYSHRFFL